MDALLPKSLKLFAVSRVMSEAPRRLIVVVTRPLRNSVSIPLTLWLVVAKTLPNEVRGLDTRLVAVDRMAERRVRCRLPRRNLQE